MGEAPIPSAEDLEAAFNAATPDAVNDGAVAFEVYTSNTAPIMEGALHVGHLDGPHDFHADLYLTPRALQVRCHSGQVAGQAEVHLSLLPLVKAMGQMGFDALGVCPEEGCGLAEDDDEGR